MENESLHDRILQIVRPRVHAAAIVPTVKLRFSEEVVSACKANFCGRYNTTWTCPPGVGTLEELKARILAYAQVLVFTTCHEIEDSFDIEGMGRGREEHGRIADQVIAALPLERYQALGAEGCGLCTKCTYPDAPCRFPERAKPSIEACGIDVVHLARTCGIHYKNGINTVTYFTAVLFG